MADGKLTSWKEIARYLGWDVKTCQRWEKGRGLPVHRLEGSKKSRVIAYHEELDLWLQENFGNNSNRPPEVKKRRKTKPGYFFAFLPIAAILLYFLIPNNPSRRQPSDFRIESSNLVILNAQGKELWRHDTKLENLVGDEFYRNRFQRKKRNKDGIWIRHAVAASHY